MTPHDRLSEANNAKAALDKYLAPAFTVVEATYARRLTDLAAEKPWEAEKITKLATALKIARSVRAQIEAIVADGKVAESEIAYAAQIERIPTHKRNILGL